MNETTAFKMAAPMYGNERKRKVAIQAALKLLDSSSDVSSDDESIIYAAVVHILNKRLVYEVIWHLLALSLTRKE